MYGSSFCIVTRRPRAFSRRPREEAVMPFPRDEATPPVTKMCLVNEGLPCADRATQPRDTTLTRDGHPPAHAVPQAGPVDEQEQRRRRPRPVVEAQEEERGDVEGDGDQPVERL